MNLAEIPRVPPAYPERLSNRVFRIERTFLIIFVNVYMKKFFVLLLALLGVIIILYAGLNGLIENHSYGLFFTFIGAITTVGLGLDVVNHLKIEIRKNSVRKLGRL